MVVGSYCFTKPEQLLNHQITGQNDECGKLWCVRATMITREMRQWDLLATCNIFNKLTHSYKSIGCWYIYWGVELLLQVHALVYIQHGKDWWNNVVLTMTSSRLAASWWPSSTSMVPLHRYSDIAYCILKVTVISGYVWIPNLTGYRQMILRDLSQNDTWFKWAQLWKSSSHPLNSWVSLYYEIEWGWALFQDYT